VLVPPVARVGQEAVPVVRAAGSVVLGEVPVHQGAEGLVGWADQEAELALWEARAGQAVALVGRGSGYSAAQILAS